MNMSIENQFEKNNIISAEQGHEPEEVGAQEDIEKANEVIDNFESRHDSITYNGLSHRFLELASDNYPKSIPSPDKVYGISTSKGEEIRITHYNGGMGDFFIAEDLQGKVLGLRKMGGDNAFIAVKEKGRGIASAVDTLMDKHMEETGGVWNVKNANKDIIIKLEKEYADNPSTVLAKAIDLRKQEQENWQRLYGEEGKLGFNKIDDYNYQKEYGVDGKLGALDSYLIEEVEENNYEGLSEEEIADKKIEKISSKIFDEV